MALSQVTIYPVYVLILEEGKYVICFKRFAGYKIGDIQKPDTGQFPEKQFAETQFAEREGQFWT